MIQGFQKLKIRTKMTLSFSVPLILIGILLSMAAFRMMADRYETQTIYSANQAFNQAASYLENHIRNMNYVQLLIGSNADLLQVIQEGAFAENDTAAQYREYWILDNIISSIDLSNGIYHCALYVPDRLVYAEDEYHFFPLSRIPETMNWQNEAGVYGENRFFTGVELVETGYREQTQEQIALLKAIYRDDTAVCVARVGVSVDELEAILQNADSTQKGVTLLVNGEGELLASSGMHQSEIANLESSYLSGLSDTGGNWVVSRDEEIGRHMLRTEYIQDADWTLISFIEPQDFYGNVMIMYTIFGTFVILMLTAIFVVSYTLAGNFTKRLTRLSQQMQRMQQGNWAEEEIPYADQDEIGMLFSQFYYMKNEIRKLMKAEYRLGKDVKTAELRALQAQINPHFLYNTLDLISWEAKEYGAKDIVEIVQSLGKFYRISLNKGRELVTVRDELAHVQAYVKIENYHFDNVIFFQVQAPEELLECACMNIMLQPFVENAIMHGIVRDSSIESCHIMLQLREEEGKLVFEVTDDGPGMTEEKIKNIFQPNTSEVTHGYGAQNINFRIKLLFGEDYGVSYESKLGQGTKVTITIPKLTMREASEKATE